MKHCGLDRKTILNTLFMLQIHLNNNGTVINKRVIFQDSCKLNRILTFENCLIIFTDDGHIDVTDGKLTFINCEIIIENKEIDACITSKEVKTLNLFNTFVMNAGYLVDEQFMRLHLFDSVLYFSQKKRIYYKMLYLYYSKIIFEDKFFFSHFADFLSQQVIQSDDYKVIASEMLVIDNEGSLRIADYLRGRQGLIPLSGTFHGLFINLMENKNLHVAFNQYRFEQSLFLKENHVVVRDAH